MSDAMMILLAFAFIAIPVAIIFFALSSVVKTESGKKAMKITGVSLIAVAVLVVAVMLINDSGSNRNAAPGGGGGYSASTNKCGYCGRTYSAGDSAGNYMNIARTGLCNSCYAIYKSGSEALGQ